MTSPIRSQVVYSLPLLVKRPDKLRGFIAVAPVNLPQFMEQLTGVTVLKT